MAKIDEQYTGMIKEILKEGEYYKDTSRDCMRLQIPSYTLRHKFKNGFPAITAKKLAWKQVVSELIWFLRGDNNIKYLVDNENYIWNEDAYNAYKKVCRENDFYTVYIHDFIRHIKEGETMLSLESLHGGVPDCGYKLGDVGQNYSKQWREYGGQVDQIRNVIKELKKNKRNTRLKVEAWNPSEIGLTALPPCHTGFQIVGVGEGFELHWNQRSTDTYLGAPFNISSYGALAYVIEIMSGVKAIGIEANFKCVHLYDNSLREAEDLLKVDFSNYENCTMSIKKDAFNKKGIDQIFNALKISDFELINYTSAPRKSVKMIAPKDI